LQGDKAGRERQHAQLVGAVGFLLAASMPFVLWHRAIWLVAEDFRFEADYLVTGWTGYALIAAGLLFFVPVLISIGRPPNSRMLVRSQRACLGWGVSLYTLGALLASQVAIIADGV